jgi:hypothetical protein
LSDLKFLVKVVGFSDDLKEEDHDDILDHIVQKQYRKKKVFSNRDIFFENQHTGATANPAPHYGYDAFPQIHHLLASHKVEHKQNGGDDRNGKRTDKKEQKGFKSNDFELGQRHGTHDAKNGDGVDIGFAPMVKDDVFQG